jgi:hypothetical protein
MMLTRDRANTDGQAKEALELLRIELVEVDRALAARSMVPVSARLRHLIDVVGSNLQADLAMYAARRRAGNTTVVSQEEAAVALLAGRLAPWHRAFVRSGSSTGLTRDNLEKVFPVVLAFLDR